MRIRDALGPVFRDEDFADLFPRRGQPAWPPGQLAMVSVLQFIEGLSDRQAVTAVRDRIAWKYALLRHDVACVEWKSSRRFGHLPKVNDLGQCTGPVPASACVVSNRGVRSLGKRPRTLVPSKGHRQGEGRTGEEIEPSTMPRQLHSRSMGCTSGRIGASRWKAAGADLRQSSGSGVHHRSRGTEGTQPGRISHMRNVTTPTGSRQQPGRPTVRNAQFPSGRRRTQ
ncbi:MAG: transposase [Streptomycetaceae bacterium]|nr:transposase [Streptomycetaceae bacterium]